MQDSYTKQAIQSVSFDHLLNISNEDQISSYLARVKDLLTEIEYIRTDQLSLDQIIDLRLVISQLNLELVKWEEAKSYEKDPSLYLPFDAINYLLPTWGGDQGYYPGILSLSNDYRLLALLSRLRQIPSTLHNGIRNLKKPVRLLTERALKLCDSFSSFLKVDVPSLLKHMSSGVYSPILEEVIQAAQVASLAVVHYKSILITDVLPLSSDSHVSLGKSVYDKLLAFGHFINDSSALLKSGQDHFSLIKEQLKEVAADIDPNSNWYQITQDVIRPLHPSANNLIESYLNEITRARDHVKGLVPDLPFDESVVGFYTPSFLVPFSPFGDFLNPPPFSTDITRTGYLMLHSVAARSLPPSEEEQLLQSHDYTWISVIAPHECYPGHHLQILFSHNHYRIMRRFYKSPYFYEGWGLYCEELAFETGFFRKELIISNREEEEVEKGGEEREVRISSTQYEKLARLTQLRLQLWRAARVILDIKLHRNEMSLEDVRSFLLNEILFDPLSVDGEVYMYISQPTYAPCYVAGYLELMELRERKRRECEEKNRQFDLMAFHEEVLRTGCLPFPLLNEILLGNNEH